MALTSQKNGISVASVATKMSVVIPILSGIIYFKESLSTSTILGIILAIISVYLTAKKETGPLKWQNIMLPLLVFLGAGTVDTFIKFLQHYYVKDTEIALFSATTFGVAFVIGIPFIFLNIQTKKNTLRFKNIIAGILLGVPNYFSLLFMIKMLASNLFSSAVLFTIHNIAIVVLTTILGVFFFKEHLNLRNSIGLIIAVVAIFLMTNAY
jgi:drug/metabolite transporter (DMT)-like permease